MDTSRRRPTPEGPRMSAVSRQLVSLLLVGSLVLAHCSAGLPSFLMDCQANEQFIECGSCEGSCQDAIVPNCRKECKPPRCECQAKLGFVRAHDGACIPVAECATYRGAYFGGGAVIPPSAPRGGGRTAADNGGGEFGSPPSIAPPSFTGRTPFADQVIATGASPPVVVRPKERQRQLATQSRQSQMNLFADLANSGVTQDLGTAPETSTWATGGHRPPAPAGLSHNRSPSGEQVLVDGADSPEEVTAKCGGRKCPGIEQATKGLNAGPPAGGAKRTKTKSQPYLFAYINPPSSVGNELGAGEDEVDAQLIGHSHEDFEAEGHATQLSIRGVHRDPALIPPLPANLRIFRGRRNPPRWLGGSIRWE